MPKNTLRIATRNSPLALWQAKHIKSRLLQYWPELHIDLLPMTTSGDMFLKERLNTLGGKGLFVKELEEALLDERADLAVHSIKDVPTTFPNGLDLPVICTRDNPFDALISLHHENLHSLPLGATMGTTSLRRQSQLHAARPDLRLSDLRGNVQTRLSKLANGDFDAIILAAAGLERLNMSHLIKETLSPEIMLPACGQGALGIECRIQDDRVRHYISPLHDPHSAVCVQGERHVNALLGGNCHVPLAVYCTRNANAQLLLRAKITSLDGLVTLSDSQQGKEQDALQLAEQCAKSLLSQGADVLLSAHHD